MERNRRSSRFSYITGISFESTTELAEENELEKEIELQDKPKPISKAKQAKLGISGIAKNMVSLMNY